jgi:ferredoxin
MVSLSPERGPAATGGLLTDHDVVSVLKTSGIEGLVEYREVILPQLGCHCTHCTGLARLARRPSRSTSKTCVGHICSQKPIPWSGSRAMCSSRSSCGACIVQCPFDALCFESPSGGIVPPETVRRFKLNLLGTRVARSEESRSPEDRLPRT